jgi:cyanate permease
MEIAKKFISKKNIIFLIFITIFSIIRNLIWVLPSPLMNTIVNEMQVDYAQGGMLMFIVTVMMGVSLFIGSLLIDHLGAGRTMVLSLMCFALDGVCAKFAVGYGLLLFGRMLSGIGYGLNIGACGVLVTERFDPTVRLSVNSYNFAINSVGMMLGYYITVPLYNSLGSWKALLLLWSGCAMVIGIAFWLIERKQFSRCAEQVTQTKGESPANPKLSSLRIAVKNKVVWCITLSMAGFLWLYTCYNTYLPSVLMEVRNLTAEHASAITGTISTASLFGCVFCILAFRKLEHKKTSMLVFSILLVIGAFGIMLVTSKLMLQISAFLIGFSYSCWIPITTTYLMEVAGGDGRLYGAIIAIASGTGSVFSVLIPSVFDLLHKTYGMRSAMLIFSSLSILVIFGVSILPKSINNRDGEHI